MRVHHLFISPGHNYYGQPNRTPGEYPTLAVPEVECVAGQGIRGDRFFHYRENFKGQITFFDVAVFAALRRELGLPHAQPAATRRNVFLSGARLGDLIGREFELQGLRFAGTEEAAPCEWMDVALGAGSRAWLEGRGGLRARILTSGPLRVEV
jgi:hypothetical protein